MVGERFVSIENKTRQFTCISVACIFCFLGGQQWLAWLGTERGEDRTARLRTDRLLFCGRTLGNRGADGFDQL